MWKGVHQYLFLALQTSCTEQWLAEQLPVAYIREP